jgi:hypothetical protein
VANFNLRHLVRAVLADSTMTDPHALAAEVSRRIDDADLRPALEQCLANVVREEIRSSRNGGLPVLARPATPRLTLHTQPEVMAEQPSGVPRPVVKAAPERRPGPSRSALAAGPVEHGL